MSFPFTNLTEGVSAKGGGGGSGVMAADLGRICHDSLVTFSPAFGVLSEKCLIRTGVCWDFFEAQELALPDPVLLLGVIQSCCEQSFE